MNTPAADGFRMPPEWAPHERTWMAWPGPNLTFDDERRTLAEARRAWASVARAVRRFEPVTVVVRPRPGGGRPRRCSAPDIELVERDLDDAWMRDIGPTFLTDGTGRLAAVDWVFNGWGAQDWARWEHDAKIAAHVVGPGRRPRTHTSPLVNEGGGIHVDGEGTVLLTETVQLGPGRNPGWTQEAGRGRDPRPPRHHQGDLAAARPDRRLRHGFGTRGHVDIVAAFARPGVVLVHTQPDPAHPDHERLQGASRELLRVADRRPGPAAWRSSRSPRRPSSRRTASWVDYSYINHYLCNGGVVLCGFDDPRDEERGRRSSAGSSPSGR